ncbi:hypothetical protein C8Q73DRAFT_782313 [Cubamyces lactineus]|nr:hypothetical protein C8Q73DRAFT_782313 [Cubamyces lactineus]
MAVNRPREPRDGEVYDVWEHSGKHEHPRPPYDGYLTKAEEVALDLQIRRRPDATAHQLRTGDSAPGSVPLAVISPALSDPQRARYQVNKGRERLDLRQTASKGGGPLLHALGDLNKTFGSPFLVDSGFVDRAYFVMQSPFMRLIINEAVDDWLDPIRPGPEDSRHGVVTDGDHTFFRDGLLMTSCAFSTTLSAWVPVLYSWIDGQSAEDHRLHFRQLNKAIMECAGDRFDSKLLASVMDFSAAQRAAFAEEYADAMIQRFKSWDLLGYEAQNAQRRVFVGEASAFVQGCEVHFWRSGKRIQRNGALVPPDQSYYFEQLLRRMLDPLCTESDFDVAVRDLRRTFPRIQSWISWWLQPLVARMLFPVKKTMSEEDAARLPRTSNPVETQHSLLHHASGKGHNLIADGHVPWPSGPTEPPPRRERMEIHPNDGRAPDTLDALERLGKPLKTQRQSSEANVGPEPKDNLPQESTRLPTTTRSKELPQRAAVPVAKFTTIDGTFPSDRPNSSFHLASYSLSHNSCFTDHPTEAWFRAFVLWPPEVRREALYHIIPTESLLSSVFFHFDARLKWILSGRGQKPCRPGMEAGRSYQLIWVRTYVD